MWYKGLWIVQQRLYVASRSLQVQSSKARSRSRSSAAEACSFWSAPAALL